MTFKAAVIVTLFLIGVIGATLSLLRQAKINDYRRYLMTLSDADLSCAYQASNKLGQQIVQQEASRRQRVNKTLQT